MPPKPKYSSLYVPMLHYETISFNDQNNKYNAICTVQASSCFIVAVLCKNKVQNNLYQFKGAYLSHINARQINENLNIKDSILEFIKEMNTYNPDDYIAIISGGTREDSKLEKVITDKIEELRIKLTNFRSIYSFPAKKLFKKVNEELLNSDSLDPSSLKEDGYMKQVSFGITCNGIRLFTERSKVIPSIEGRGISIEEIENTGRYSKIILTKSNEFCLQNIEAGKENKKQPVRQRENSYFLTKFNKESAMQNQFTFFENESDNFIEDEEAQLPLSRACFKK